MTNDHLSDEGKGKRSIIILICSIIQLVIAVLVIVFLVCDCRTPAKEKSEFELLLQQTGHEDPEARLQSMDSLEKMFKDHPGQVDRQKLFMQMADVLSDEDPYVRYKAVTIFG